jgi:tetratricopeptide (TPR) repeat protein
MGNGCAPDDPDRNGGIRSPGKPKQKMTPSNVVEISVKPGVQSQIDAAIALRAAGNLEEAWRALANPCEYNAYLYTLRGEVEFELGRFQDAALSYFAVVQSEPDDADAHYNLALALQRSDRWDASCQAFARVLALDPSRDAARLGLGASLLYLSRLDEALGVFYQCSTASARPAAFGKAVALQLLHRFGEAEAAYEELLSSDPDSEEALSNLIALSIETGDMDHVREYSQRLQRIAPLSQVALQGLATAALERQDHHAAARFCDRIVQLAPDCLEAWHNLGIALGRILSSFSAAQPVAAGPVIRQQG